MEEVGLAQVRRRLLLKVRAPQARCDAVWKCIEYSCETIISIWTATSVMEIANSKPRAIHLVRLLCNFCRVYKGVGFQLAAAAPIISTCSNSPPCLEHLKLSSLFLLRSSSLSSPPTRSVFRHSSDSISHFRLTFT